MNRKGKKLKNESIRNREGMSRRPPFPDSSQTLFVECPICHKNIVRTSIDKHVEECLQNTEIATEGHDNEVQSEAGPDSPMASSSLSLTIGTPEKGNKHSLDGELGGSRELGGSSGEKKRRIQNERKPLAERMRPASFDTFRGNTTYFGRDAVVRKVLDADPPPSMILYGPPGCGKTTIANIIKNHTSYPYHSLSCCVAGMQDIRTIAEQADNQFKLCKKATILFMDEIHRFNKKQQDVFLPYVERGTLILIGATTENPSFSINNALLSRCQVIALRGLTKEDLYSILQHAYANDAYCRESGVLVSESIMRMIAAYSDGDARMALNMLDVCCAYAYDREDKTVTEEVLKMTFQQRFVRYDKNGEEHYNLASALQKSIRGSDVQGAIYWLGRMLEGGEDPLFIARRLVVIASEDVGLADPQALSLATASYQACRDIGVPECNLALTECCCYLALASKSNEVALAYNRVRELIHSGSNPPVPMHIRNAPIESMEALGYGIGYQYGYNKNQTYLPPEYLEREFISVDRAVNDLRCV